MLERATLRLDTGREVRVEVAPEDLSGPEIVVRRTSSDATLGRPTLPEVVGEHLSRAARHPAGTTDRLLGDDRSRGR